MPIQPGAWTCSSALPPPKPWISDDTDEGCSVQSCDQISSPQGGVAERMDELPEMAAAGLAVDSRKRFGSSQLDDFVDRAQALLTLYQSLGAAGSRRIHYEYTLD
jgi:hypothetical protein